MSLRVLSPFLVNALRSAAVLPDAFCGLYVGLTCFADFLASNFDAAFSLSFAEVGVLDPPDLAARLSIAALRC